MFCIDDLYQLGFLDFLSAVESTCFYPHDVLLALYMLWPYV